MDAKLFAAHKLNEVAGVLREKAVMHLAEAKRLQDSEFVDASYAAGQSAGLSTACATLSQVALDLCEDLNAELPQ